MPESSKRSDPQSWAGKNSMPGSKVNIGHFRYRTGVPVKESSTRPEVPPQTADDGRAFPENKRKDQVLPRGKVYTKG